MLSFLKKLFTGPDIKKFLEEGALILDVRTKEEFRTGHVKGSLNIPLNSITQQVKKIKKENKTVIACCRSGRRSGYAARVLRQYGIEAYNGGSWQRVQRLKNN